MKTLYRFKLNDDGTIETREINKYQETGAWFTYEHNSATVWVAKNKLDKMSHRAVYTFDANIEHSKEIMYSTLIKKAKEHYDEFESLCKLAETLV